MSRAADRFLKVEKFLIILSAISSFAIIAILIPFFALFLCCRYDVVCKILGTQLLRNEFLNALKNSLLAATVATAILVLVSIPLGYVLARVDFRGKTVVESLVDLPLVVPHPIVGVMLLVAFGSRGIIPLGIEDTFWGIVSAMMFVAFPLAVDAVKLGFLSVDPMLEYVARSLGASSFRTFLTISLPLCYRNILAGAILAFARALSEVGSLLVLAPYPETVTVLIIKWFDTFGLPYAVAVSSLYLLLALALFLALRALVKVGAYA